MILGSDGKRCLGHTRFDHLMVPSETKTPITGGEGGLPLPPTGTGLREACG